MNKQHACPHCRSVAAPHDALERLHDCYAAIADLAASAGKADLGMVSANNLAALLGLLNDLHRSALDASQPMALAAPAMLAALEAATAHSTPLHPDSPAWRQALAAIAKARGQEGER